MSIKITDIDINVVKKIAKEKAEKNNCFPYKESKDEVFIATTDLNQPFITDIEFLFSKKRKLIQIEEVKIKKIINNLFISDELDFERLIIKQSIDVKASDIHFEPTKNCVYVRIRIDGTLKVINLLGCEEYSRLLSKIKIQSNLDITEKRKPQDGKLSFQYKENNYDLRVSIINTIYGEKLVLRILYGNIFNHSIEKLNFNYYQKEKLERIINTNNGVAIVTGPTGSGKSTTLYSILQKVNNEDINVMTLEDPVEVEIKGVNQIALNRAINMDFAVGLRSILRQDPDVIMVGEVRDDETAQIVARAGITGHKVYTTIHTKDPREVYFRLEEMGVEGYLIRDALVGIISQRLIKVLCEKCKIIKATNTVNGEEVKYYDKVGCEYCNYTGYRGRELVAAIHHIDKNLKGKLVNIYNDTSLLTNDEMLDSIKNLFSKGKITKDDMLSFIEAEELKLENYEV